MSWMRACARCLEFRVVDAMCFLYVNYREFIIKKFMINSRQLYVKNKCASPTIFLGVLA